MRIDIAPLQPPTLASVKTWGIQQELVVPTRGAKVRRKIEPENTPGQHEAPCHSTPGIALQFLKDIETYEEAFI